MTTRRRPAKPKTGPWPPVVLCGRCKQEHIFTEPCNTNSEESNVTALPKSEQGKSRTSKQQTAAAKKKIDAAVALVQQSNTEREQTLAEGPTKPEPKKPTAAQKRAAAKRNAEAAVRDAKSKSAAKKSSTTTTKKQPTKSIPKKDTSKSDERAALAATATKLRASGKSYAEIVDEMKLPNVNAARRLCGYVAPGAAKKSA